MAEERHGFIGVLVICLALLQFGCVVQAPPPKDASQELSQLFAVAEKVNTRVGVYLNQDLRSYAYKQEKSGGLQMEVGKNITPVCMTMAKAMFDSAIEVDSLPPYVGSYRPDVEAVIEPEILYASGKSTGSLLSTQIVAMVKLRLKAYDLSGRIIWQGEATGENQREQVDVISTLLGNVDPSSRAAGQAGLSAAVKIIKDFNVTKPPELYSLLELKTSAQPKGQKKSAGMEQSDMLFQRGMFQYDKKNFQQALYSFQQADRLSPADLSTKFYLGVCQMYTGQKSRALDTLNYVIANGKRGDLTGNCKQWVQRLNDPLKISIVFSGSGGMMPNDMKRGFLQALTNCGMYEVLTVQDTAEPVAQTAELNKYMDEAAKKKARVIFIVQADRIVRDLLETTLGEGDIASEFTLNTTIKAYSTQKKKPVTDFILFDNLARMKKQADPEALQTDLLQRSANRVVLSLLGNEIF